MNRNSENIVKRANQYFRKGDYCSAKELYKEASIIYGKGLFKVNITLCEMKGENGWEENNLISFDHIEKSHEVKKLEKEIMNLKVEVEKKDIIINSRFRELATLTELLEKKSIFN